MTDETQVHSLIEIRKEKFSGTIMITGASSGIGAALVQEFSERNWRVIAIARRESLLLALHQKFPKQVSVVCADITTQSGLENILKVLSPYDTGIYLVHNAGTAEPQPLNDMDEALWDRHFALNVRAPMILTKMLLPYLKGGRVLNISSSAAHTPISGMAPYACSKAAFLMLTRQWSAELSRQYSVLS